MLLFTKVKKKLNILLQPNLNLATEVFLHNQNELFKSFKDSMLFSQSLHLKMICTEESGLQKRLKSL